MARKWNVDYAFYQDRAGQIPAVFQERGRPTPSPPVFRNIPGGVLKRSKSAACPHPGTAQTRPPLNWPASRPTSRNVQGRRCMRTDSVKKYVIPNIPYLFILWACLKLGTAYRLAPGADFAHKLMGLGQTHRPGLCRLCAGACTPLTGSSALWARWASGC